MTGITTYLTLQPRDPLIARDGRPFGDGLRMKSLDWFHPSVTTGSLRTLIGKQLTGDFDAAMISQLKGIACAGPFPALTDPQGLPQLSLPAPHDIAVQREKDGTLRPYSLRPESFPTGGGCSGVWSPAAKLGDATSLEEQRLFPVTLPASLKDDFKPTDVPAWWSTEQMARWLTNTTGECFLAQPAKVWPDGFVEQPRRDQRSHVSIDSASQTGADGMLFQTIGLDLERMVPSDAESSNCRGVAATLSARITVDAKSDHNRQVLSIVEALQVDHPLGGERRLVHWQAESSSRHADLWACPEVVKTTLAGWKPSLSGGVRLALATPALFSTKGTEKTEATETNRWLPGWLQWNEGRGWIGSPPGITSDKLTLRLVGANIARWQPISGWSYERGSFGPKPVRRLVPAGGVYFFLVESGNAALLADLWLKSVCHDEQNQQDGFGLGLWGVWEPHDKSHSFGTSP